jgi:imidazolonepropionase
MANMACVLFGMTPEEGLAAITCHAAAALGLGDRGTLEAGKRADFALWDASEPAELVATIGGIRPSRVFFEGKPRQ